MLILAEVISFRNLYKVKVQKCELIKIIDDRQTDRYTCVPIRTIATLKEETFTEETFANLLILDFSRELSFVNSCFKLSFFSRFLFLLGA